MLQISLPLKKANIDLTLIINDWIYDGNLLHKVENIEIINDMILVKLLPYNSYKIIEWSGNINEFFEYWKPGRPVSNWIGFNAFLLMNIKPNQIYWDLNHVYEIDLETKIESLQQLWDHYIHKKDQVCYKIWTAIKKNKKISNSSFQLFIFCLNNNISSKQAQLI